MAVVISPCAPMHTLHNAIMRQLEAVNFDSIL